jgi:glycosyltransferase involved in cell wall biosynthesis
MIQSMPSIDMDSINPKALAPKRICMITHSFYESDNRVLRYAETLSLRGDIVEVLALRRYQHMPRQEVINGVKVYRIQDRIGKTESSKLSFLWPVLRFMVRSFVWLTRHQSKSRYDLVHVHSVPDFLVLSAAYARFGGTKVILDIHDVLPELFSSKFGTAENSVVVRLLRSVERFSASMADHVILANGIWLNKYVARSAKSDKCSAFINYVDERVFNRDLRSVSPEGPVIMFPGGLQWHQGVDIAIRAFAIVLRCLPGAKFHIYGDGNMKPHLVELVRQMKLGASVRFFEPVPIRQIASIMGTAHLGIVPKRADSFGNEAYSTKIMEFMALGVPVVVADTAVDRYYFNDSVVKYFKSGNDDALAMAMLDVLTDHDARVGLVQRATEYADKYCWGRNVDRYLRLVDSLIE